MIESTGWKAGHLDRYVRAVRTVQDAGVTVSAGVPIACALSSFRQLPDQSVPHELAVRWSLR